MPTSRAKLVKALVFVGGLLASFSFILLGEAGEKPAAVLSEASDTAAVQDFELQPWAPFFVQQGIASWYGPGFHGRRTASGTRYNMHELTAAHRSLPFGSLVRVENPRNGAAIIVQITDRGPFVRRNIIDLSRKAAELLDVRLHRVRIAAFLPPRDSSKLLSFAPGWQPVVVPSTVCVLTDTLGTWDAVWRRWQLLRDSLPELRIFVGWAPDQDSAQSRPPHPLRFYLGKLSHPRFITLLQPPE